MKKRIQQSKRISNLKQNIRDELSKSQDDMIDRQVIYNQKYKPILDTQKDLIQTINNNRTLDLIQRPQENTIHPQEKFLTYEDRIFTNEEEDVIKDNGFITYPKNIRELPKIKNINNKLMSNRNKINSKKNPIKSQKATFDYNVLLKYKDFINHIKLINNVIEHDKSVYKKYYQKQKQEEPIIEEVEETNLEPIIEEEVDDDEANKKNEASGSGLKKGVRSYKQAPRHAYKIDKDGKYGGILINVSKLLHDYKVEAVKDGQIIYQNQGDLSLVNLLTKKFNPKIRYSNRAIQIFNDLNMLSNIAQHKSSQKSQLKGSSIYFIKPEDMIKRLKLLTGSRVAGNTNISHRNEMWEIIDKLVELKLMTKKQHDEFVKKYLM